ncbi:MAG TPA: hypothetical protein ENJ30_01290 [Desulfobulbaceae bacterium]|nr:hypothetical protein [Desulfobulbaceae bacterium]
MTTRKIIAILGFLLVFALPSSVLAGSVSGMDWFSEETASVTNAIEPVIPTGPVVAEAGIGQDWYSETNTAAGRSAAIATLSSTDNPVGIGLDWYSEETTKPPAANSECLPAVDTAIAVNC